MKKIDVVLFAVLASLICYSASVASKTPRPSVSTVNVEPNSEKTLETIILSEFKKDLSNAEVLKLKKRTLTYSGKAIPSLIKVMKSDQYPDKNRWVATFLVGRIMGKKSAAFLAKFLNHPSWVMRMASLKTLLVLKETQFANEYAKALKDGSLLVRKQALENIRKLNLTAKAPQVWSMLYDKRNYYAPKDGSKKRTNIISDVIETVGDLKFKDARAPLLSMIQKDKYKDIFEEIDYSLGKIIGKKSPEDSEMKKRFWKNIAVSYKTF